MAQKMRFNLSLIFLVIHFGLYGQIDFNFRTAQNCGLIIKFDSTKSVDIYNDKKVKLKTLTTSETAYFNRPQIFENRKDKYLRIQQVFFGTGSVTVDYFYHINLNCRLDSVEIKEVSKAWEKMLEKDEDIRKGEQRTIKNNEVLFYFGIWRTADSNCCPSQGYIQGKYDIKKVSDKGTIKYIMSVKEQNKTQNPLE